MIEADGAHDGVAAVGGRGARTRRENKEMHGVTLIERLTHGARRHDHALVHAGASACLTHLRGHADHHEAYAGELHLLPHGLLAAEEFVGKVAAYDGHLARGCYI